MVCATDTFWINDFKQLVCSPSIFPKDGEPLATTLNKMTRFAIVGAVAIAPLSISTSISVILICFVFLITIYYFSASKEKYTTMQDRIHYIEPKPNTYTNTCVEPSPPKPSQGGGWFNPVTPKRFCNDAHPLTYNDPDYISDNQLLIRGSNPKTHISPIVTPPSHDISSWAENGLTQHSLINSSTNFDLTRSGYGSIDRPSEMMIEDCTNCYSTPCLCKTNVVPLQWKKFNKDVREDVKENFWDHSHRSDILRHHEQLAPSRYEEPQPEPPTEEAATSELQPLKIRQPDPPKPTCIINSDVTTGPDSWYKDNLLTQTLQPGVFQKSKVGEPINSMIGISFQQQFVPTEVEENQNWIKYTQQNPTDVSIHPTIEERPISQTESNVYDPRFTGYGDSDRSYVDNNTGQPRFFYDDINAIKMPNYIVRSNVDIFPWASQYGPDVPLENYDEHRQLANNAFHDAAITFRTDMQERLMRKRNAEMWQIRAYPKSTANQLGNCLARC